MDYKSHFNFLLKYEYWANNKIAETIQENNLVTGKPIELYSHIINAEIILLARIKKTKHLDPFEVRSIEENNGLSKSINSEWDEFINSLQKNDFNNLVEYNNIKGEHIVAKIWEVFLHMINHSTYHRGQIASSLRNMDITPPTTDLMSYARLKKD
jgi:uncharacterized damage-inducible protein DinB